MRPETEHIVQVLKTAMRILGCTNREMERRLGVSGGYLSRLFAGAMELRFEHVVDIAEAMGLSAEEIFRFAYPEPRMPTVAALRLREATGGFQSRSAAPLAAPPPEEAASSTGTVLEAELEKMMLRTFRKFFTDMAKSANE
jgi:transcriptional regulator with XRE-family HTH domain